MVELGELNKQVVNGGFLMGAEPKAARISPLASSVIAVSRSYIKEGGLSDALQFIKDRPDLSLTDYWVNTALLGFRISYTGETKARFDDAVSSGGERTIDMYLDKPPTGQTNSLNDSKDSWVDSDLPKGMRPKSFTVPADTRPVLAIVALDPSQLGTITQPERESLLEEIGKLRLVAASDDEKIRDGAGTDMSDRLRGILSNCLLANDTFTTTFSLEGKEEKWRIPFDLFGSLKALHCLISGDFHSGNMRQGAVRIGVKDEAVGGNGMRDIIVAGSGLNSAIDEMVARNFAKDVVEHYLKVKTLKS